MRSLTPFAFALLAAGCAAPSSLFLAPPLVDSCADQSPGPSSIRVASYNLKSGLETSLDQVGDEIEKLSPDVIALEEVDRGVDRTHRQDQSQLLADRLGYQRVFAAAMKRGGGDYGIALLSRLPLTSASRIDLHEPGTYEPRVAIDATVCAGVTPLRIVAVHADIWAAASDARVVAEHVKDLLGSDVIVAGDFNQTPKEAGPKDFTSEGFVDVIGQKADGVTFWPSENRIDYLFADPSLAARASGAGIGSDSKASDHFAVWVDLNLQGL